MNWKRILLGGGSLVLSGIGLYLDYKDGEQAKIEQKQAAYDAGCDVAREFYEKKGNPNAKRKKKSS